MKPAARSTQAALVMASTTETENVQPANLDGSGGASRDPHDEVQGSEVYSVFLTLTAQCPAANFDSRPR
jgi:hypothetical protein